ncbi:type II toxin-antitoxin system RelE/ParE family toxin [Devosia sp. MC1541]|uniref:type II toxin-antitoxin system RelE/ParE family toxin n=1 Tax=Devosia sp. MC1541 TaxID=2725264 RepID=UPI00145F25E0|nr:type II toxin-antitoxin system RelE/ParE family toxin [Devosia sp. MC1541]
MDGYSVVFHPDYVPEFRVLPLAVKEAIGEAFDLLRDKGPTLGRPQVDTLNGSKFRNMKELLVFTPKGAWRVAFAFDPDQNAIVLCGGDKAGVASARFYKQLIAKADQRYEWWLSA